MSPNLSEEPIECRTCMESTNPDTLITPCACSGTRMYVHYQCWYRWYDIERELNCRICRNRYDVQYVRIGHNFWKYLCEDWLHKLFIALAILFITFSYMSTNCSSLFANLVRHSSPDLSVLSKPLLRVMRLIDVCIALLSIQYLLCLRKHFIEWKESHFDTYFRNFRNNLIKTSV